jgi:hypothetical protein
VRPSLRFQERRRAHKSSRSIAQEIFRQASKIQRHLSGSTRSAFSGAITLQKLELSTTKVATAQVNFDGRAIIER